MKRDVRMPQGKYRVGRDIPEGIYLIAALNDYSHIKIEKEDPQVVNEYYHLDDENSKICHVEIIKGDVMYIDGNVKVRHITKFMAEDSTDFSLLEEIEDFRNSTLGSKNIKTNTKTIAEEAEEEDEIEEELEDEEDDEIDDEEESEDEDEDEDTYESTPKKKKLGFWGALGTLLSSSTSSSSSTRSYSSESSWSSPKKKHSGKCDGDCANCPPHYGYRYGRWYYGHSHSEGCVFGGNKCNGGRD